MLHAKDLRRMAKLLGCSESTITTVMRGQHRPNAALATKLAKLLTKWGYPVTRNELVFGYEVGRPVCPDEFNAPPTAIEVKAHKSLLAKYKAAKEAHKNEV